MHYYKEHQFWFWTYLQNWPLIFLDDVNANALNHYWSLAIEEQYYLIWPIIVLIIKKPKGLIIFCFSMLLLVIAARLYIWYNAENFPAYERAFLFTRVDGILIGSMLAAVCSMNSSFLRKYFTAFLLLLTTANYLFYLLKRNQQPDFPVWGIAGFTTFSFLFSLAIYEAVMKENKFINIILTNTLLTFLGKYSYGIYIFHWPIALMTAPYFTGFMQSLIKKTGIWQQLGTAALCTMTAIFVSVLSYHLFEKHFLKLKRYF
jgi:peptidoglycan/LPS O-acetylase OafA/YrhL